MYWPMPCAAARKIAGSRIFARVHVLSVFDDPDDFNLLGRRA